MLEKCFKMCLNWGGKQPNRKFQEHTKRHHLNRATAKGRHSSGNNSKNLSVCEKHDWQNRQQWVQSFRVRVLYNSTFKGLTDNLTSEWKSQVLDSQFSEIMVNNRPNVNRIWLPSLASEKWKQPRNEECTTNYPPPANNNILCSYIKLISMSQLRNKAERIW